MNYIKKYVKTLLTIGATFLLSSCIGISASDVLKAPLPSKDYTVLQKEVDKKITAGAVYSPPEAGEYRNTIQLVDIDGDGTDEAIAFLREARASGKFNVYVYKKAREQYLEIGSIKGSGTAIDSVSYPIISPTGTRAIVINWKLGRDINRGMSIATLDNVNDTFKINTILDTNCLEFIIYDFDDDGAEEIITIVDEINMKKANLYEIESNKINLVSSVSLSEEILKISKTRVGQIKGGINALFIDSLIDDTPALITDILIYNNNLENITINKETGSGMKTYRPININVEDVNRDSIIEVPKARAFEPKSQDSLWLIDWYAYSADGSNDKALSTYHNISEGWFYKFNSYWVKNVKAYKRTENGSSHISFQDGNTVLLEVYIFVGDNRDYYASQEGNIVIAETSNAVYCVKTPKNIISIDEVMENFSLLNPEENIKNET